ncbi:NAD(P)-dependent oxidoreductase [Paraburkholderia sp. A3BS-1L]|uniref:NAD(P)-dependent oxidoreductase n=1 Tax=Paraburkholderia sp. A3BS-1L TaxID=3028375 RepID=UPI003DA7E71F
MNVLWIGYGKMGEPMARRVAAAGHVLRVDDMSAVRRGAARAHGFALAEAAAAKDAALIVSSLPNDAAARAAFATRDGVLAHARPGTVLVETSTISVGASAAIAAAAVEAGVGYVRAPVSGSVAAASSGTLTSFVSGPAQALDVARPVIGAYASTLVEVGVADEARVMKLAINLMVTTLVASLGEAYALCAKGGIAPDVALEAIGASAIGSPHLRLKAQALARRDFTATFTVAQMRKDVQLIGDGARGLNVPVLLGAAVEQLMSAAEASGYGDEDYLACAKVIATMAGMAL